MSAVGLGSPPGELLNEQRLSVAPPSPGVSPWLTGHGREHAGRSSCQGHLPRRDTWDLHSHVIGQNRSHGCILLWGPEDVWSSLCPEMEETFISANSSTPALIGSCHPKSSFIVCCALSSKFYFIWCKHYQPSLIFISAWYLCPSFASFPFCVIF